MPLYVSAKCPLSSAKSGESSLTTVLSGKLFIAEFKIVASPVMQCKSASAVLPYIKDFCVYYYKLYCREMYNVLIAPAISQ